MARQGLRTGDQSSRKVYLEQLKSWHAKGAHSASDTQETAALTQLESWVMGNPTPSTLDQATMWGNISEYWRNSGMTDAQRGGFMRMTLKVIYPRWDWIVQVAPNGKTRIQAKFFE